MKSTILLAVGIASAITVMADPPGNDPTTKFIDPRNMDQSVKPGDNFFCLRMETG